MKVLIESTTIFLLLNVVAAAPMYFMYDEIPDVRYSATIGSTGTYKNRLNNHKKYFIGNNNQKYMKLVNEHAVDSHFTLQKSPEKPFVNKDDGKYIENTDVIRHVYNYRRKSKEDIKLKNDEHHVSVSTKNDSEGIYQDKIKTTIPDNHPYSSSQNLHNFKQREYLQNGDNIYDKEHNLISVNEYKAAVSKDEKGIVKNSIQQLTHQLQGFQHKVAGMGVKDKVLHKTSVMNERNPQLAVPTNPGLERDTQIAPQNIKSVALISDFISQRLDSKKRDTVNIQPNTSDSNIKSNSVSDKIRKCIHKDVNNNKEQMNTVVPSSIGNREDIVDVNETPYALFYRTNSEHIDDQETLIENPMAEPIHNAYSGKMAWNIENEAQEDSIKTKSKRAPNVKIHKKVKNHTSYRNR